MPINLRDIIQSEYNYRPDGIYFKDYEWNIHILKPNYQQRIFYNRCRWLHQSNEIGIRDIRQIEEADIVVLGDSFIYGHGVNIKDTLSHYLEEISGRIVANLGVQGDYPPSQYLRLKHLGLFLKPKIVLFFINGIQDASDFLIFRPKKEYINRIILEEPLDYSEGVQFSNYLRSYLKYKYKVKDYLCAMSYTARMGRGLLGAYRNRVQTLKKITDNDKNENMIIIKDSMIKIIADTQRLCKVNNVKLIVVFQVNRKNVINRWREIYRKKISPDFDFDEFCKQICTNLNISFLDLREKSPKDNYFLKNDEHYSSEGNRWAANCVYKYLKENNLL